MRWLWQPFSELQVALEDSVGTSEVSVDKRPSIRSRTTLSPHRINDHVYEVHKPAGRPSVELVFFHGLQLDPDSSAEPHFDTWISQDKAESWLSWLVEDLPEARVLTVSYDAAARTTKTEGRVDMYVTTENLIHSLTADAARVGQDGCPVVLVGHCLGGLVMKEICSKAHHMTSLQRHSKAVENFLANLKGLFFYATPHHGSLLVEANRHSLTGPLIKALRSLEVETARSNEDFRQLRISEGWKTFGMVGLLPVKLKLFEGIVVPEASARSDMDDFYAAAVDHYNICRPVNKQSSTYHLLLDFALPFVLDWQRAQEEAIAKPIQHIPSAVPYEDRIWTSELSPLQLLVLRAVEFLLVSVHFIMFYVIPAWVATTEIGSVSQRIFNEMPKITFPHNTGTDPRGDFGSVGKEVGNTYFRMPVKIVLLEALNILSAIVTPLACVYLLRFYMTRRWAHPLELVAELLNRPLFLDVWWNPPSATQDSELALELGSRQDEGSTLEVGYQRKEDSNLGVGFRHQEDSKLEVEPLLLEQRLESQVVVEPPLLPRSEVETKLDVDPLLGPPKETRRLRSRGPNTNKAGPL